MKTMTNEGAERNKTDDVEEVYTWLDEIISSGAKKNISRDFSDGVLMAEVLKVYYPRYVDIHNYTPANNIRTKKENWNTLNRKVFSKIEMKLSNTVISQLVNSQQGTIDKVLTDLKSKIGADQIITKSSSSQKFDETEKEQEANENEMLLKIKPSSLMQVATETSNISFKIGRYLKNVFRILGGWIITSLFFWTWIFHRSNKEWLPSVNIPSTISGIADTDELVSHSMYEQLKQELHQKVNTISTLNQRIAHLRKVLRIKNVRIAHLTLQISNPTDSNGNGRSVHSKRSRSLTALGSVPYPADVLKWRENSLRLKVHYLVHNHLSCRSVLFTLRRNAYRHRILLKLTCIESLTTVKVIVDSRNYQMESGDTCYSVRHCYVQSCEDSTRKKYYSQEEYIIHL